MAIVPDGLAHSCILEIQIKQLAYQLFCYFLFLVDFNQQAGLVTAATDGRVNFWSLANLRDPVESVQIGDSVSCLAVAPESGNIICGDDMGAIYTVQSPNASLGGGSQRSRRQVKKMECGDEGHFGMVTSVATKNLKSAPRAGLSKGFLRGSGGLFLSSGVDWTVKLWAPAYTDKSLVSLVSQLQIRLQTGLGQLHQ